MTQGVNTYMAVTAPFATLRGIANANLTDVGDTARLFALVGVSSADSQISVYDAKYHYNFWRPVTAIREGDHDGNARTIGDPAWQPFLATPPYPEYHSGADLLAASITGILRLYFGSDELSLSVSSSAANLVVNPRHYTRLTQVEQETVDVRIYQGIHFRTADELGRFHGRRLAHWTFMKFLRPLPTVWCPAQQGLADAAAAMQPCVAVASRRTAEKPYRNPCTRRGSMPVFRGSR